MLRYRLGQGGFDVLLHCDLKKSNDLVFRLFATNFSDARDIKRLSDLPPAFILVTFGVRTGAKLVGKTVRVFV